MVMQPRMHQHTLLEALATGCMRRRPALPPEHVSFTAWSKVACLYGVTGSCENSVKAYLLEHKEMQIFVFARRC